MVRHGVTIIGYTDLVSRLARQSSTLYSNNLLRLTEGGLRKAKDGNIVVNFEDDAIRGLPPWSRKASSPGLPRRPSCRPHRPSKASNAPITAPKGHGHGASEPMSVKSLAIVFGVGALLFLLVGLYAPASFLTHFTVFVLACFVGWHGGAGTSRPRCTRR